MRLLGIVFGGALIAASFFPTPPSFAETQFRLDASAPGVADPHKGIDYIGSVLAFNLYDALVAPGQNGAPVAPHLATGWKIDGNEYVFKIRAGAQVGRQVRRHGRLRGGLFVEP